MLMPVGSEIEAAVGGEPVEVLLLLEMVRLEYLETVGLPMLEP